MILYHLTTPEKAQKIISEQKIMPGKFCDGTFEAVFMSEDSYFDWVERDIILGGPHMVDEGVVLEISFPDHISWEHDPDRESYGPWVCHKTTEALAFQSVSVVENTTWRT